MITIKATNPGPNINRWMPGYWTGTKWKSDAQFYPIDSPISVPITNRLTAFTADPSDNLFGPYYSNDFVPADGQTYIYDILTGVVTPESFGPAEYKNLTVSYRRA